MWLCNGIVGMGVAFLPPGKNSEDGWMDEGWWEHRRKITRFLGKQERHQVASELVPVDKLMFEAQTMEETASEQQKQSKTGMSTGNRTSKRNWTLVLASCTEEAAYRSGSTHMTLRARESQFLIP